MTPAPLRTAVYLRISLDRNMDGLAIDRQRDDCVKIAGAKDWEIVEEYVDQSKSATDKTKSRPAYDRMVADYANGKFEAIVCYDLDRLTRQPRQLEDWIEAAEDRGLKLVTANGEADLTTDGGRMYARIKAAVARAEVERKSARQSSAHQQRAAQGRAPKGTRPLGYTSNGEVVASEAEVARKIFAHFVLSNGATLSGIAQALSGKTGDHVPAGIPALQSHRRTLMIERNERRIAENIPPKPVPENKPWSSSTILGILRNPRYAGYSVYTNRMDRTETNKRRGWTAQILRDDDGNPVTGQWEALVTEEVWWEVQRILDEPARITNRTGSTARKHLGAGLYLCGVCKTPVITVGQRYRCKNAHVTRSRHQIDDFVLSVIRKRIALPDLLDVLPNHDEPRVKAIEENIRFYERKIKRAQYDYDNEIIEGFDLKRIRARENVHITRLTNERQALLAGHDLDPILRSDNPPQAFDNADFMLKRRIINFLCTVHLYHHPRGRKTFDPETVKVKGRDLSRIQVDWTP